GRVGLLQPAPDFLRVLLASVAARPLGGEVPAPQVQPDGAHGQGDATLPADQVADGAAVSQPRGAPQCLRAAGPEQLLDTGGLLVGEQAAGAERAARAVAREGIEAAGDVGRPPAADGLAGDPQEVGDLGLGEPQFTAVQGAQTQRFQDL